MRTTLRSCLAALLLAAFPPDPAHAQARSAVPAAQRAFDLVRPVFDGNRAMEVVRFVDRFWRLPGNKGFDASIDSVTSVLRAAGYVDQANSPASARLTYRIESKEMRAPTWEPESASVALVGADGRATPLLSTTPNRNMLTINSQATPAGGVEAEIVALGAVADSAFGRADVKGKIVYADGPISRTFAEAVQKRGAIGVLGYAMPAYLKPQVHRNTIQFSQVPLDTARHAWGILLSTDARDALRKALAAGPVRARVTVAARTYVSRERTLIAEVRGAAKPDERWAFSAHVQEPGANDNASGVGTQAEMARVLASLVKSGKTNPQRTITFIWGNEIAATRAYLAADSVRTRNVRWGMSLDMVGENTAITGGTFLIEKMPDPSAVWTRGDDHHTEWGGSPIPESAIVPHYFNDYVLRRCLDQAAVTGWVVRTNPFEGGSDHTPFLDAKKPAVLFWHFTDEFYHTDGDRADKVSPAEMRNSGVAALVSAMTLVSADGATTRAIAAELERAATERLGKEEALSKSAVASAGDRAKEAHILRAWGAYYRDAIRKTTDIPVGGADAATQQAVNAIAARVEQAAERAAVGIAAP